jgi:hypothetical protein
MIRKRTGAVSRVVSPPAEKLPASVPFATNRPCTAAKLVIFV